MSLSPEEEAALDAFFARPIALAGEAVETGDPARPLYPSLGERLEPALLAHLAATFLPPAVVLAGGDLEARAASVRRAHAAGLVRLAALDERERMSLVAAERAAVPSERSYVITAGRLSTGLASQLAACTAQHQAWREVLGLEGPFDGAFIAAHPTLPVDTRLFPAALAAVEGAPDGVAIHGENAAALRFLARERPGPFKCVLIDPPYNASAADVGYRDLYPRDAWRRMIRARLELARPLLSDDGVVFVHIDEHEHAALSSVLEEVFGEENVLGSIVWDKRNPKGDARGIAAQHEYIAVAVKDARALRTSRLLREKAHGRRVLARAEAIKKKHGGVTPEARAELRRWVKKHPDLSGGQRAYSELDDQGRVYRPVSMAWPNKKRPPDAYFEPLIHPMTGKPCPVPKRGWRNPPATMRALLEAGRILFGPDESTQPTRKYLLEENLLEPVPSLLYFGGSDDDLLAELGVRFELAKPLRVAEYLLAIGARAAESLVLDFYAGSGTTAHAALRLGRRYVVVEQAEDFEAVLMRRMARAIFGGTAQHTLERVVLPRFEALSSAAGAATKARPGEGARPPSPRRSS